MTIVTELYSRSVERLPKTGQHILAHQSDCDIIVYQAYKPSTASFAVNNQCLGGADFSYNRMSWIKTSFLWMMYRSGWAKKQNQERILALRLDKKDFEEILRHAVFSSFDLKYYESRDLWKKKLNKKDVRLQWDPDHDPHGNKIERRAIQVGLKGEVLKDFGQKKIKHIEDITVFVSEQKNILDGHCLENILVPLENIFVPQDRELSKQIGLI